MSGRVMTREEIESVVSEIQAKRMETYRTLESARNEEHAKRKELWKLEEMVSQTEARYQYLDERFFELNNILVTMEENQSAYIDPV